MGKLLTWVILFFVFWLAWKALASPRRPLRDSRRASEPPGEPMLRCAHCGVYLPASDALERRGLHYCSPAHRDAGPGGSSRA